MHKISLFMIFIIVAPLSSYGMIEKKDEQPDCPICLSPPQMPTTLPCNHVFCNPCLTDWALQKTECPTCRTTFALKDYHQPPTHRDYMRHYSAQFLRGLALGNSVHANLFEYKSPYDQTIEGILGLGSELNYRIRLMRLVTDINIPVFGLTHRISPTNLVAQYYVRRLTETPCQQPQQIIYSFQAACLSALLHHGIAKNLDTPLAPLIDRFDDPLKTKFPAITRCIDRCADCIHERSNISHSNINHAKEFIKKLTNVSSLSCFAGFFSGLFCPLIPTLLRSSTEYITPYVKEGFSKSYQLLAAYIATMRKP